MAWVPSGAVKSSALIPTEFDDDAHLALERPRGGQRLDRPRGLLFFKQRILVVQELRHLSMRIRYSKACALGVLFVAACHGCGATPGVLTDLMPIKGKVTYKGKPLVQGIIRFEPDGYGRMATGKLQPDGSYVLSTLKDADGVVAGLHKVFITDPEPSLAKDRAFQKYMQANGSTLTADVSRESTEFNFDLK
jgi:hypothetical protein